MSIVLSALITWLAVNLAIVAVMHFKRVSAWDWLLFKVGLDPVWRGQGFSAVAAVVEVSADRDAGLCSRS